MVFRVAIRDTLKIDELNVYTQDYKCYCGGEMVGSDIYDNHDKIIQIPG